MSNTNDDLKPTVHALAASGSGVGTSVLLAARARGNTDEPPPLMGFCDECNMPVFGGVSHMKITGCLGTTFHQTGKTANDRA